MPAPVARLVSFRGASPPWAAPALRGSRRGSLPPARLPWSGLPAVRPVSGLRCCGWSCASRSGPEALHGLRPAFRARSGGQKAWLRRFYAGVKALWRKGLRVPVVVYVPTERRQKQHG